jgi:hypothetical protein
MTWDRAVPATFLSLCAVGIFLSSFFVSGANAPIGDLDQSWEAVLNFAAQRHLRFGSDIIFTYKRLGFLFLPTGFRDFHFLRTFFAVSLELVPDSRNTPGAFR